MISYFFIIITNIRLTVICSVIGDVECNIMVHDSNRVSDFQPRLS